MRVRVLVYALCMLVTGSINTISIKFQDMVVVGTAADGTPILYQHPAFQSACMFLGEVLCLIPFFLLRARRRQQKAAAARAAEAEYQAAQAAYEEQQAWLLERTRRTRNSGGLGLYASQPSYSDLTKPLLQQPRPPPPPAPPPSPLFLLRRALAFAVPTLCDATATTLLNIGLFYTYASTYQMLRGTLVLFAGFFTVTLLRRTLYLHHWLGMVLIMAGAALVGAASVIYRDPSKEDGPPSPLSPSSPPSPALLTSSLSDLGSSVSAYEAAWAASGAGAGSPMRALLMAVGAPAPSAAGAPLFGNAMVVLAQMFNALQFILEEKFLGQFRIQPLLAVGIEGAWGLALCALVLPLASSMHVPSPGGGYTRLDNLGDALRAILHHPQLCLAVSISVVSIGFFNFFGLSVTKALSGASRATIDAVRTLLVWLFSLAIGWESFHGLQVVGFLVLLSGTSLYNEIHRSLMPSAAAPPEAEGRKSSHSASHSSRGSESGGGSSNEGGSEAGSEAGSEEGDVENPEEGGGKSRGRENGRGEYRPPHVLSGEVAAPDAIRDAVRGGAAPPAHLPTGRTHAQAIAHPKPKSQPQATMARSLLLGYNTLTPRDLVASTGEDEGGDGVEGASVSTDVADPMLLASTPYFGQGVLGMADQGDESVHGGVIKGFKAALGRAGSAHTHQPNPLLPREHNNDHFEEHLPSFASWEAAAPLPPASLTSSAAPVSFPEPVSVFVVGGGGVKSSAVPFTKPPRPEGGSDDGTAEGGFLAFMAARKQQQQQQGVGVAGRGAGAVPARGGLSAQLGRGAGGTQAGEQQ